MIDRAGAYAALAALLQSKVGSLLATPVRRKLPTYSTLDQEEQPTLALIAVTDDRQVDGPLPALPTLRAVAVIYARCDEDPAATAEDTLFGIVGAIDDALKNDYLPGAILSPGQLGQAWSTLGGKVLYARPGGPVLYDSGQTEAQGIAQYPIELVMVPA